MSRSKNGEEASHPPSATRLRQARRDGQVAHTPDLVTVITLIVTLFALASLAGWFATEVIDMFRVSASLIHLDFDRASRAITAKVLLTVALVCGVTFLAAAISGIIASLADTMGLVVSAKPLVPDLNRLNPVKGLGQIFSLRNLIEFISAILKAMAVMFVLYIVVRLSLADLVRMPYGGVSAVIAVINRYIVLLAILTLVILIVAALAQVYLQRWLHRRDLRMTLSEVRREHRDSEGDPLVRSRRRQIMRSGPSATRPGLAAATFVIRGHSSIVGLRFVESELGVPIMVAKIGADGFEAALAGIHARGLRTIVDPILAMRLTADGQEGQIIPQSAFRDVARIIVKNKLSRR